MSERRHIADYSAENVASEPDGRLYSPAFERNAEPIRATLEGLIGTEGAVLEIGSGTGQHAAHFAAAFPRHRWVPSDCQPDHLRSIAAWRRLSAPPNLDAPLEIDATSDWAERPEIAALEPVAVFAANVIHIAPWAVAEGIVAGAGRVLGPGGRLIFYGPFREEGRHTGEGNRRFDAALRADNPAWGVRDTADVADIATRAGFGPPEIHEMPANNRIVAFTKR